MNCDFVSGIIALFWCFLWFFFVRESPNHDPWVSEAEKNYIQESIGLSDRTKVHNLSLNICVSSTMARPRHYDGPSC